MACPFCPPRLKAEYITLKNEHCLFIQTPQPVLIGSGIIIPRAHRETPFDLTAGEWNATFDLLGEVKDRLDLEHAPQGYNVGWNCGEVAGQSVFHVHMHVIPRYEDEPFARRGIRYWIKQDENKRPV